MTSLTSLIERIEATTGMDRAIDAEIACMMYAKPPARPYTTSIDAALTLLPDGHSYALGDCNENNVPWACVTRCTGDWPDFAATGADVTLALLAAILRARQTEPRHDES